MKEPKIPTGAERLKVIISFALTVASFAFVAYHQTDQQWMLSGMIAGFLYLLTVFFLVFKDVDFMDVDS